MRAFQLKLIRDSLCMGQEKRNQETVVISARSLNNIIPPCVFSGTRRSRLVFKRLPIAHVPGAIRNFWRGNLQGISSGQMISSARLKPSRCAMRKAANSRCSSDCQGIISDVQPSGASQPAIVEFREIENSWTDVIKDLNCQQHPQQPHWLILSPSITYRVMSLSLSLFVSCRPQTPTFLHQQDVATKRATPNQLVPAHWRRPDVPDSPNHVLRPWIVLCARIVRDLFPLFSDFMRFKCLYMYVYMYI